MRNMGAAIGGQVTAAVLAGRTVAASHVPSESAYVAVFWLGAAVAAVGLTLVLFLGPRRRAGRVEAARAAS
jgi:hypothetical protein